MKRTIGGAGNVKINVNVKGGKKEQEVNTVELILRNEKGNVHRVIKGEAVIFSVVNERSDGNIESHHGAFGRLVDPSMALSAISGLSQSTNLLIEDILNGKST